jgi:Mlc titration factor MtfA (ptsG expression regulator)
LIGSPLAWFRALRRRRILRQVRIPDDLWRSTLSRFAFARGLSEAERGQLRDLVVLFLHEKEFTGAAGLEITTPIKLAIAAQACVVILELGLDYYRDWVGIIVYPEAFVPRHSYITSEGTLSEDDAIHAGEAWLRGPVILSWADVQGSGSLDGVNVVIHEFAHKLDMLNGTPTGFPPLHHTMNRIAWTQAFSAAFNDFDRRVQSGERTRIDPYAAQSPAEFFAVMSEAFFEIPRAVQMEYPQVYEQLKLFYRQDPVRRMPEWEDEGNDELAENLAGHPLVAVWRSRSAGRRGDGDGGH